MEVVGFDAVRQLFDRAGAEKPRATAVSKLRKFGSEPTTGIMNRS